MLLTASICFFAQLGNAFPIQKCALGNLSYSLRLSKGKQSAHKSQAAICHDPPGALAFCNSTSQRRPKTKKSTNNTHTTLPSLAERTLASLLRKLQLRKIIYHSLCLCINLVIFRDLSAAASRCIQRSLTSRSKLKCTFYNSSDFLHINFLKWLVCAAASFPCSGARQINALVYSTTWALFFLLI